MRLNCRAGRPPLPVLCPRAARRAQVSRAQTIRPQAWLSAVQSPWCCCFSQILTFTGRPNCKAVKLDLGSMFGLGGYGRNTSKTFRPRKNTPVGAKGLQLKKHIDATLGQGNLLEAVRLPPGEDIQEWLAVNTVDFYNAISVLYSTLAEFCTDQTCEVMTAGTKYEYLWADGVKYKKPVRLSAPEYVDKLFDWVEAQIDDPSVFPGQFGEPFPANFMDVVRTIFKRLFRVYGHMYHSHFKQIIGLGEEAHLNTCFKHFIIFVKHFDLIEEKELVPLSELIEQFLAGKMNSLR